MRTLLHVGALLALSLVGASLAHAQTPTIAFTMETSAGTTTGQVVPRLTWSTTPAAASCTASGDAAWTGTKAASGTQTLAAVTPPKSYTIRCNWPGSNQAVLSWTAPTQNTDGTPLTNLSGFSVHWGTSSTALSQSANVPGGAATRTYTVTNLTPGAWFFGARALTSTGAQSALSNVATKTIAAAVELTQTVGITVPNPPTGLSVE